MGDVTRAVAHGGGLHMGTFPMLLAVISPAVVIVVSVVLILWWEETRG